MATSCSWHPISTRCRGRAEDVLGADISSSTLSTAWPLWWPWTTSCQAPFQPHTCFLGIDTAEKKCGVNSQAQLHLYPVQGRVWLVNIMGLLLFRDASRWSRVIPSSTCGCCHQGRRDLLKVADDSSCKVPWEAGEMHGKKHAASQKCRRWEEASSVCFSCSS